MRNQGHQFDPGILREYDIRGIVGKNLKTDDALALGRTMGSIAARAGGKLAVVGYDGRLTSPSLEEELVRGLGASGLHVLRIGLVPTPAVYFVSRMIGADVAVMVTGSHNPSEYNGFKMVLKNKPFFGEAIQSMAAQARAGNWLDAKGSALAANAIDAYVERILEEYDNSKGLRVAWDAGNGAMGPAMMKCLTKLPGEHFVLNEDVDGTFPAHHPDPTVEKNLAQLKDLVAEEKCDIGIGFDGDGDRIGVVDDEGVVLWGDQLLTIYAREVLAVMPGAPIIADVKASQVLFDEIEAMGGEPIMCATGHSIIKSKMMETGAPIAGEMSGHIFFADRYLGFDDALYAAVRFVNIVAKSGKKLSDIRKALPKVINTPEIRVDVDESRKFEIMAEIKDKVMQSGARVNDTDGVRVMEDHGWWLIRASNTQNCLVVRCEADSQDELDKLVIHVGEILKEAGVRAPS